MGVSEIPYTEMKSFFELMSIEPELYEIEIIEMFDRIAMEHYAKQQEKEQKKAQAKPKK